MEFTDEEFTYLCKSKPAHTYTEYLDTPVCLARGLRIIVICLKVDGFPGSSDSKESACSAEDPGSISGSERSPGEGNS